MLHTVVCTLLVFNLCGDNAVGDDVSIATRAANLVVSLTHTCAEELVSSTMLDGLLTTVVTAHFKKIKFILR